MQPSPDARMSVLCQTLRNSAQPALTKLMNDDSLLENANRAFATSDALVVRNVIGDLTANLNTIAKLLGKGFAPDANSTVNEQEQLMKGRLEAVASAQNDALNLIEGYVQTQDMGRARDSFPGGRGANAVEVLPYDSAHGTGAEVQTPNDPTAPATGANRGRVEGPAAILQSTQTQIGQLEDSAGIAIMAVVQVCNSH
ncbi:MAG TPA: hypothetical protein VFE36_11035 [Candidatus Baltobacteraceae bacterium]|nr:hypothetical protein [Candidatus Baltobacteraceae bacterium]